MHVHNDKLGGRFTLLGYESRASTGNEASGFSLEISRLRRDHDVADGDPRPLLWTVALCPRQSPRRLGRGVAAT
jgi:hypothetical protein